MGKRMMMTNSLGLWYVGWSHADEDNNIMGMIDNINFWTTVGSHLRS